MNIELDEMVQDHEKRITTIEVSEARLDERLKALVQSTNNLKWGMWAFTFVMLLTMVWQLLGREGYKDVTGTLFPAQQTVESIVK